MADLSTLYCSECGSKDVQVHLWVNPNDTSFTLPPMSMVEDNNCYCNSCHKNVELETLEELWERFGEVPINNDDEIEEDFLSFPTGTSRFDVWHWFDERCPNNLHDDLLHK